MNSGLYALAGASATATAAACAKRLLEPMTKVSNRYFGLSRPASLSLIGASDAPPPGCFGLPRSGRESVWDAKDSGAEDDGGGRSSTWSSGSICGLPEKGSGGGADWVIAGCGGRLIGPAV